MAASTPKPQSPPHLFPFLSLPLELREKIYTETFPPKGVRYIHNLHADHYHRPARRPPAHLPLFLTCRQIHHEAQGIWSLTTRIAIESKQYPKRNQHVPHTALRLALRSFPPTQARMLTRLERSSYIHSCARIAQPVDDGQSDPLFAMWTHVVVEACIIGEYFPRVRRLDVVWRDFAILMVRRFFPYVEDCDASDVRARRQRVQDVARVLVRWVEDQARDGNCIPPVWLRIDVDDKVVVREENMKRKMILGDALVAAHQLLAATSRSGSENLNESGRKWLEGLSTKRKRRRNGWIDED